jgi:LmbE family N-acetylglucosaminyl deacetylase
MSSLRKTLVIAPHADDETLGMGATIAKKTAAGENVTVAIMTGHGEQPHPLWGPELWEGLRTETAKAIIHLGKPNLEFCELPGACLSEHPNYDINKTVLELVQRLNPHELYLPYYHDLHHDHQQLAHAGLVASRAYLSSSRSLELVAMYETPTETHLVPATIQSPFVPNLYENVTGHLDSKLAAWAEYASQQHLGFSPRSPDAIKASATLRGSEIGVEAAEAFVAIRHVRN